jgi:hypothetical protein
VRQLRQRAPRAADDDDGIGRAHDGGVAGLAHAGGDDGAQAGMGLRALGAGEHPNDHAAGRAGALGHRAHHTRVAAADHGRAARGQQAADLVRVAALDLGAVMWTADRDLDQGSAFSIA